jgi:hypothetical protein
MIHDASRRFAPMPFPRLLINTGRISAEQSQRLLSQFRQSSQELRPSRSIYHAAITGEAEDGHWLYDCLTTRYHHAVGQAVDC